MDARMTMLAEGASDAMEAARIQVLGALQAAELASNAALGAGIFQGFATMLAGSLALMAGVAAYWGALRQVRLAEENHAARVKAYKFHICAIVRDIITRAIVIKGSSVAEQMQRHNGGEVFQVQIVRQVEHKALDYKEWESHALLGADAVLAIHELNDALKEYSWFRFEASKTGAVTSDFISSCSVTVDAQGSITQENVINSYRIYANKVVECLIKLRDLVAAI